MKQDNLFTEKFLEGLEKWTESGPREWDCPPICVNLIIAYPQIKSRAGHKLKANP